MVLSMTISKNNNSLPCPLHLPPSPPANPSPRSRQAPQPRALLLPVHPLQPSVLHILELSTSSKITGLTQITDWDYLLQSWVIYFHRMIIWDMLIWTLCIRRNSPILSLVRGAFDFPYFHGLKRISIRRISIREVNLYITDLLTFSSLLSLNRSIFDSTNSINSKLHSNNLLRRPTTILLQHPPKLPPNFPRRISNLI